jgi:hypothetical protein
MVHECLDPTAESLRLKQGSADATGASAQLIVLYHKTTLYVVNGSRIGATSLRKGKFLHTYYYMKAPLIKSAKVKLREPATDI